MAMALIHSKAVISGESWHKIPNMLKLVDSGPSLVSKPWIAHSEEQRKERKIKTDKYIIRSKTVFKKLSEFFFKPLLPLQTEWNILTFPMNVS